MPINISQRGQTTAAMSADTILLAQHMRTGRHSLRILHLVGELTKQPTGLRLADLSVMLNVPKGSVRHYLKQLLTAGYILHIRRKYRLGPRIFRLAGSIVTSRALGISFRPHIEELMSMSGESAYIGVLDRNRRALSYVDAIYSLQPLHHQIPLGETCPLNCAAAGRLLLAYADPDWTEDYLGAMTRSRRTVHTINDPVELRRELASIREEGCSISSDELTGDSTELSAPIFGVEGSIVASITLAGPSKRMRNRLPELKLMVINMAARASKLERPRGHGPYS